MTINDLWMLGIISFIGGASLWKMMKITKDRIRESSAMEDNRLLKLMEEAAAAANKKQEGEWKFTTMAGRTMKWKVLHDNNGAIKDVPDTTFLAAISQEMRDQNKDIIHALHAMTIQIGNISKQMERQNNMMARIYGMPNE